MKVIKKHCKDYLKVLKTIKKYDTIVVYRHELPDFDASGTQNGLATWLKDSFPNKKIIRLGKNFDEYTPKLFPSNDVINEEELNNYLAIVVDTSNEARIDDKSYKNASEIIKFDHHPGNDNYGNINIVDTSLSSCSELIVNFTSYFKRKYPLSNDASKFFLIGIIGDSQRFLTSSTSSLTLDAASLCIKQDVNLSKEIYQPMYERSIEDIEVQKYIYSIYKVSNKGVAYYILKTDELDRLNIKPEQTKKYLSTFSNIKEIEIWCAISEDPITHEYWVSIRSKNIPISDVAKKYRGGGHALASGANLKTEEEINSLIEDLDSLI